MFYLIHLMRRSQFPGSFKCLKNVRYRNENSQAVHGEACPSLRPTESKSREFQRRSGNKVFFSTVPRRQTEISSRILHKLI